MNELTSLAAAVALLSLSVPAQQFAPLGTRMPAVYTFTTDVAVGDLDGDGRPDIVFTTQHSGTLTEDIAFFQVDNLMFEHRRRVFDYDTGLSIAVAIEDADGDGDLDVLFGRWAQNVLYVNDGAGGMASRRPFAGSEPTRDVAWADFDGDGGRDVFFANANQDRLFLFQPPLRYRDVTATSLPAGHTICVAAVDVDRDGDLDLFCGDASTVALPNRLLLNDGRAVFTDVSATHLPGVADSSRAVAPGDVDGDGDVDLWLANAFQDRLLLNDGSGRYTDATSTHLPVDASITCQVALADVDHDGDLDAALAKYDTGAALLLNDGSGRFVDATAQRVAPDTNTTRAVALADVDRDGDADLVVAKAYALSELFVNRHRQLEAPWAAQVGAPFRLECHSRPGYATGLHAAQPLLGFARVDPPLLVPPFGIVLVPPPVIDLPWVGIAPAAGVGVLDFTVPGDSRLAGTAFHVQAVFADVEAGAVRLRTSNVTSHTIRQ
ncbi:MAG: VCBS repeat-containing protein [Planctomycetes bacterium]|nr:VCBS repeat-containing protein [Planctomycetota bacterium]